jgi:lysophospholipase L1-like esterase
VPAPDDDVRPVTRTISTSDAQPDFALAVAEAPLVREAPATAETSPAAPTAPALPGGAAGTPAPPAPAFRRLRQDEAPRFYVAGDSTALVFGGALATWGTAHGAQVWDAGWMACSIARGGIYRYAGVVKATEANCNDWLARRTTDLRGIRPHVVVISAGAFDVLDRQLPGDAAWPHIGEPDYDAFLRDEITAFTELMASRHSHVVWLVQPDVEIGVTEDGTRPIVPFPESDPRRMARFNDLVRDVVAAHPGVDLLDLKAHLASWPGGELDRRLRPDGIHASPAGAEDVAQWLGPQLLALVGANA